MNSQANAGHSHSPAARNEASNAVRIAGYQTGKPDGHDPEAEALLRRFLAEVHGYRKLGNAALRNLEERLEAMARQPQPEAPRPAASKRFTAIEAPHARRPAPEPQPAADADGRTLSDRLYELSAYLHADLTRQETRRADTEEKPGGAAGGTASPRQPHQKTTPTAPVLDRVWFEERFAVLRGSIDELADKVPVKRLDALEAQFRKLMERLDEREASHGGMGAVEAGLQKLAAYLEDSKYWAGVQDKRVHNVEKRLDRLSGLVAQSHAAITATAKGLEIVAKGTGPNLARTTADLVINHFDEQIERLQPGQRLEELGREVNALSTQSQHHARSTDQRLKELQARLDEAFVRPGNEQRPAAGATAKSSTESLETYLASQPREEADDYDRELIAAAQRAARLAEGPQRDAAQTQKGQVRYQIPYSEFLPDDERRTSHTGLVVAAVILLLASAAMFYLNLRDRGTSKLQPGVVSQTGLTSGGQMVAPKQRVMLVSPQPKSKADDRLPSGTTGSVVPGDDGAKSSQASGKRIDEPGSLASTDAINPASTAPASAHSEGETATSIREAAVNGDQNAQFSVGQSYLTGGDGEQHLADDERLSFAARWFRRAAETGHAASQYRLATLYELGRGTPKDLAEAEAWYRRAAAQGHVKAMHNLAVLTATTPGREANYPLAAAWFNKAAEHGLADSQYNLGVLYERGLGVPQDLPRAFHWYALAARDSEDSKARERRDAIARLLPPQELAKARSALASWTALASDPAVNGTAPEPPIGPADAMTTAVVPDDPRTQVMNAAWRVQIAPQNTMVLEAQRHLERLGYKPGPADGIPGPRTTAAVRLFETRIGLIPTGQVTETLVLKLALSQK